MRLIPLPRLALWLLMIIAPPVTATDTTVTGEWEILDECRLIEAPINDGDSFKVAHEDREFIVRLYYVDCPETYDTYKDRLRDQARYFSIDEPNVITFGKTAKAHTEKFLKNDFTVITRWEDARGGETARYFGIVSKKNQLLSEELVRQGLARIYGMPAWGGWPNGFTSSVYLKRLKQHERAAQKKRVGIWADAQESAQLKSLNMAENPSEPLQDSSSAPGFAEDRQTTKIILNTANANELETLPGIGPALADRIIVARPFTTIDELTEIPGISIKKVNAFRNLVLLNEPLTSP